MNIEKINKNLKILNSVAEKLIGGQLHSGNVAHDAPTKGYTIQNCVNNVIKAIEEQTKDARETAAIKNMFEGRWRVKGFDTCEVMQLSGNAVKDLCRDFFEAGILLAVKEKATNPSETVQAADVEGVELPTSLVRAPIDLRSESFRVQVFSPENLTLYPQELLTEFYDYWSEPNRSKSKLRYESEKTWDLTRRLRRWAKNDYSGYVRKSQQRIEKLADILTT